MATLAHTAVNTHQAGPSKTALGLQLLACLPTALAQPLLLFSPLAGGTSYGLTKPHTNRTAVVPLPLERAQACAPRVPPQHQLQCTSTAAHTAAAHTAAGYDCQGAVLMCHFPAYSHSTRAPGPTRGGVCFFKMHEFNDLAKHANLHSVGQVASG
jgi:hypothetical protein